MIVPIGPGESFLEKIREECRQRASRWCNSMTGVTPLPVMYRIWDNAGRTSSLARRRLKETLDGGS